MDKINEKRHEPVPPGIDSPLLDVPMPHNPPPSNDSPKIQTSVKGVENAKKRLRAFSIQKKVPVAPVGVTSMSPQPGSSPGVVMIGKLASAKGPILTKFPSTSPMVTLVEDIEDKKKKPPKPGSCDTYMDQKKRTLSEIEDMKRKMELVELGIPLGLIGPTSSSPAAKVMPTKAMPPIKSFLTTEQLDEIIREAKKAKAEGREFKFDYQKLLPTYENPFQRKNKPTEEEKEKEFEIEKEKFYARKDISLINKYMRDKSRNLELKRKSERYERRLEKERDRKDREQRRRDKDRSGEREKKDGGKNKERDGKSKEGDDKTKDDKVEKQDKSETDVNLNDYLVCDSWSLENEDKNDTSSPKVDLKTSKDKPEEVKISQDAIQAINEKLEKEKQGIIEKRLRNKIAQPKVEKLQPVNDSFNFEIEEDAILDIFDEDNDLEKYAKVKSKSESIKSDQDSQDTKDSNEDFLESVINELKQEDLSDDASQDKGLVEYDISPDKNSDGTPDLGSSVRSGSVTPELSDIMRASVRSDYSDLKSEESGIKSSESGFKSTESGYKSTESFKMTDTPDSFRLSDDAMTRSTVESLEMWSFVMKICQPLLFRHDRNKCYKETKTAPSLWYTENPKLCDCVKDRSIVYEELETLKTDLVDRVYSTEQILPHQALQTRTWYPSSPLHISDAPTQPPTPPPLPPTLPDVPPGVSRATEWESEEEPTTPTKKPEMSLDQEYQRFMAAVWPEIAESKKESRSTPPIKEQKSRKKKKMAEDSEKKREAKKMKLTSENWSQESEIEEEKSVKKQKSSKRQKSRKRKRSSSTITETSDEGPEEKKAKKRSKKMDSKKKAKLAKRRRLEKKYLKKLKKNKLSKKNKKKDRSGELDSDDDKDNAKKLKKKNKLKQKKKQQKKKRSKSTSSSSDSESSDTESSKEKRRKKTEDRKKKNRKSSESQSDDLFDENILNNIKTEKEEFSPRRQQLKQREIISMKELQSNLATNDVQIKQETEENTEKIDAGTEEKIEEKDSSLELCKSADMLEEAFEERQQMMVDKTSPTHQKIESLAKEQHHKPPSLPETPATQPGDDISHPQGIPSHAGSVMSPLKEDPSHRGSVVSPVQGVATVTSHTGGVPSHAGSFVSPPGGATELVGYEMYEQLAMEYQSGVKSQQIIDPPSTEPATQQKIETVVSRASRGEIKCDWRAGDAVSTPLARPSRWGLKPGEANIVLTGQATDTFPIRSVLEEQDYMGTDAMNYDEAYQDTYGAADRLQYGDCFARPDRASNTVPRRSLDDRIQRVLGDKPREETNQANSEETNLFDAKPLEPVKIQKRVTFADGYKPGQDSDVEEPPAKRKKRRRLGCAWPCPSTHPDHVALWDALPPPPPPPGSPPRPAQPPPPPALLRAPPHAAQAAHIKFDPSSIPGLMTDRPPPMLSIPLGHM